MDELALRIFVLGDIFTNCYLVYEKQAKQGFLVDLSYPCTSIIDFIRREKINIDFVLLTHGHFDHIGGIAQVDYPFYIHENDAKFLIDPNLNASVYVGQSLIIKRSPIILKTDGKLKFGDRNIEFINVPGHTPGSCCFHLDKWLFAGDTIFFDSVGRTDIPLASHETLVGAIKGKILTLSEDTIVYPGHGKDTTVNREKKYNPFLK